MDSLCHPWVTTTNPSYRFPIFETSATALYNIHVTYSMGGCWRFQSWSVPGWMLTGLFNGGCTRKQTTGPSNLCTELCQSTADCGCCYSCYALLSPSGIGMNPPAGVFCGCSSPPSPPRLPPICMYIYIYIYVYGGGSKPIIINSNGMNIHLPAILGFTRYQGFDPSPYVLYLYVATVATTHPAAT